MAKKESRSPKGKTRFIASDGYLGSPDGTVLIIKTHNPPTKKRSGK